ncbi:MAG TPA: F0F1 ATP synthase subunit alpha, partial [Burkholderiaceae bacterium]|nr:F0F1 ATP synthase subunit alpha [Burkholderiaceae bacterium]
MSRPNLSPWLERALDAAMPEPQLSEVGRVASLADGVAMVSGLDRALADERLMFESGIAGVVQDLEPDRLGVMLLGATDHVRLGEAVYRTHSVVSVPVGSALLGRIVNAVGQPLDGKGAISTPLFHPVERDAPGILERAPVQRPLATGLKVIDAAIPVGLGQRQLIIGDRQTGKTSLALDTMLNQRETGVLCIYCAIGQRGDAVARVAHDLQQGDMLARTVVLHAGDEEVPGLAYMAPYAAMTMAEYFCSQGHDVLVVLDDMIRHAHAYRELSLLLRRPPGREAFPGDIFYIHARLLERGGQFTDARKHGSITVLPVVETQAENLSAYIPTNLISITDGQVYLSPRQVQKNQFPAAELGLSVSRVGGKAQHPVLREIASNLRVTLSQFEEQEDFARFGTRLDADTRARLKRGSAVRRALRQGERDPMTITAQVA